MQGGFRMTVGIMASFFYFGTMKLHLIAMMVRGFWSSFLAQYFTILNLIDQVILRPSKMRRNGLVVIGYYSNFHDSSFSPLIITRKRSWPSSSFFAFITII